MKTSAFRLVLAAGAFAATWPAAALDKSSCAIAISRYLVGIRSHTAADLSAPVKFALERSSFVKEFRDNPKLAYEDWWDLSPYRPVDEQWVARVEEQKESLPVLATVGKPEKVTSKKAMSLVYKVSWVDADGVTRKGVFRPLDSNPGGNLAAPRRTLAASKLARALEIDNVPHSQLVTMEGEIGVVSEFVSGETLKLHQDVKNYRQIFESDSFQALMLFEYLIKNGDSHNENWKWDGAKARSYDYDKAFGFGLLSKFHIYRLGRDFPSNPRRGLLHALKRLDPAAMTSLLGAELSDHELRGLALRRELLLINAGLRP
jgi:hypothetical protein